jgi:hypothetical protein
MSLPIFDIERVKKYLKLVHNVDIKDKYYGEYFRITDELTLSYWAPELALIPQPSILQLRIDYPNSVIEPEIALTQLRAHRNKLLITSDKLVTVDFPLSEEQKNNIKAWRQTLRELPEVIEPELLNLDVNGRFNRNLIPTLIY